MKIHIQKNLKICAYISVIQTVSMYHLLGYTLLNFEYHFSSVKFRISTLHQSLQGPMI